MAIYGSPRAPKEDFKDYIIRMDKARTELIKEGIKLPEVAIGYIYYQQASLTESQDLKVAAWTENGFKISKAVVGQASQQQPR